MSLHDAMAKLTDQAQEAVLGLWARWEEGDITEDQFRALATAALARHGAKGAALADAALAAALTMLIGSVMVATGDMEDPSEGAAAAVEETLGSEAYRRDPSAAVAVMGSAFAAAAMQDTYSKGMRDQGVGFWVRVPNPGACEMCQDLADAVMPASVDMYHHRGCSCVQRPVEMETVNV